METLTNRIVSINNAHDHRKSITVYAKGQTTENVRCGGDLVFLNSSVEIENGVIRITGDVHKTEFICSLLYDNDNNAYEYYKDILFIPEGCVRSRYIYKRPIRDWLKNKQTEIKYIENGDYILKECHVKNKTITFNI